MKELILGALVLITLIVSFTYMGGGYNNVNWDQLVPLFKALIPYLFVVGFPLIITLAAVLIVKAGKTGAHLVTDVAKHKPSKRPR